MSKNIFNLTEDEGLICGTTDLFLKSTQNVNQTFNEETTLVAVSGLHMRGLPLEKQMKECRAEFVREAITAPKYQLVKLPSEPTKPELIKKQQVVDRSS
nr:hypothetical protein [Alkalihalobacillus deserti]